jgi:3',5'-cyclic-AMP phosphodiesterase
MSLKAGGLGSLGHEQLEWMGDDVKHLKHSTPIVTFAHILLWSVYPERGWGTEDSAQAPAYLKKLGSATVLDGQIHQTMQKVEGNVTFHTAASTAFPQPAPGKTDLQDDEIAGRAVKELAGNHRCELHPGPARAGGG